MKTSYRRKLPHHQPVGFKFFVTFRLFNSIPKIKLSELDEKHQFMKCKIKLLENEDERKKLEFRLRKEFFIAYEELLDKIKTGPKYLSAPVCAQIVFDQIKKYDGGFYDLICMSIMPNHVHVLIDLSTQLLDKHILKDQVDNYRNLDQVLKLIKGASAYYCNKQLNRKGQFWERESFDTYIRNEKMERNVISYILNNPVKARLANDWNDHAWTFLKKDNIDF